MIHVCNTVCNHLGIYPADHLEQLGFQLRITCLGNLKPDNNIGFSKAFADFLKEHIGVENDRGYIVFYDPSKSCPSLRLVFPSIQLHAKK